MSSLRDKAVPPQRKGTMQYQRKVTAPQQSEMRQDTVHPKTDTSRDHQVISAGKKKSVTFGDANAVEEKQSGKHAPTAGKVTTAAETTTPTH